MSNSTGPARAPATHAPAGSSQLVIPAYGAPTATSEVSRVIGFYSVASLTVFAGAHMAAKRDRRELRIAA